MSVKKKFRYLFNRLTNKIINDNKVNNHHIKQFHMLVEKIQRNYLKFEKQLKDDLVENLD